jgi:hypothetical protein
MRYKKVIVPAVVASLSLAVALGSMVFAAPSEDAGQPDFPLPPGWTEADMQAYAIASTPGEMHEHLNQGTGVWHGKNTMWMMPGAEPLTSESTTTVTSIMDGRYVNVEVSGEMPGMGRYNAVGFCGYDNVSQQFVANWIDNHSTGIMYGVGTLSPDGKTLEWNYTFNCPITKKPTIMREIETITGDDTKTLDMFSTDPKSGEEYQMMRIELTRAK